jgi:hypothetical protein
MPSATAKPSAAAKEGPGGIPDYGDPTRTHAEKSQAEHSDQAERSGEGGFGGLPRLWQSNLHACRRRPSRAQNQAKRSFEGGLGPRPTTVIHLARQRAPELVKVCKVAWATMPNVKILWVFKMPKDCAWLPLEGMSEAEAHRVHTDAFYAALRARLGITDF